MRAICSLPHICLHSNNTVQSRQQAAELLCELLALRIYHLWINQTTTLFTLARHHIRL